MGTIRFFIRTDKPDKKTGKVSIQLVYQIGGKRERFQTQHKIWPQSWDQKTQSVRFYSNRSDLRRVFEELEKKNVERKQSGKGPIIWPEIDFARLPLKKEVDEINISLNSLILKVRNAETRKELSGITEYTPREIIEELNIYKPKLKEEGPTNEVFTYIDKFIKEHKTTRKEGSLEVYRSLKNHLQAYQKYYRTVVTFADLDKSFFRKFQNFLAIPRQEKMIITRKKKSLHNGSDESTYQQIRYRTVELNNTTIAKQLSTLKTFISYAIDAKVNVPPDYKNFRIEKSRLEVIALSNDEFERIYHYDFSNNRRLDQVRDIFCFSCVTGLRYSDLNQLRREHIRQDEIRLNIKKTSTNLIIPLNTYSKDILSKYSGNHFPLPVSGKLKLMTNQVLNRYIKELCKIVGLNEPIEIVREHGNKRVSKFYPKHDLISIHTGRKSFVTISLERGVPVQEVMATSGHRDYKSFSRYVNITEKRKKESIQKAWGAVSAANTINSAMKVA